MVKKIDFVNFYTIENVNGGGQGGVGQKKTNLVNVVCERPRILNNTNLEKLDYCRVSYLTEYGSNHNYGRHNVPC